MKNERDISYGPVGNVTALVDMSTVSVVEHITPDVDMHNGVGWKKAQLQAKLNSKQT